MQNGNSSIKTIAIGAIVNYMNASNGNMESGKILWVFNNNTVAISCKETKKVNHVNVNFIYNIL